MEEVILSLPVLDISVPEILDRYVEIDCYSKGKHPTLDSDFSAVKMGKNDIWIAATASVYQCKLLITDLDFQHLSSQFIEVIYNSSKKLNLKNQLKLLASANLQLLSQEVYC